ncbi:glycosyltransferase [Hansschlegelia plantiphila]|uniref:Glycosyl transferase family 28 C-terminal domain-containing protein n=1 Tax=Hansschlegelia plantiphila TaxID=374655 RepID=A0A9W6IZX4_9HYPH|nr:glycosyltransferase [Hansschlegelia plantiphila]GLK66749.1 hypothetical protein GCM10008179_03870 [Hansschlegelia plantiphila]
MKRPIGYYVHHHGAGHRRRAEAIAAQLGGRMTMLGTGLGDAGIDLPDDRIDAGFDGEDGTSLRPAALHYAPLRHDGVRQRAAIISGWIAREQPALMVVDVSVEVALLARLCATPTVYVRLFGSRDDAPHLEAFRSAEALLAPWPEIWEHESAPPDLRRRTSYFPGVTPAFAGPTRQFGRPTAVVVYGGGGGRLAAVEQAAEATPDLDWVVLGEIQGEPVRRPDNLRFAGWVPDAPAWIAGAEFVVAGAGDGAVADVAAARRPFLCIPEQRPYREQTDKARVLERAGAAVVVDRWPEPGSWPALRAHLASLDRDALRPLADPHGAAKAAAWIEAIADR